MVNKIRTGQPGVVERMAPRSSQDGCVLCRAMALEVVNGVLPSRSPTEASCWRIPRFSGLQSQGGSDLNTQSCVSRHVASKFCNIWLQPSFSLDHDSLDSKASIPGGDAGIVWSDHCYWILCSLYPFCPQRPNSNRRSKTGLLWE